MGRDTKFDVNVTWWGVKGPKERLRIIGRNSAHLVTGYIHTNTSKGYLLTPEREIAADSTILKGTCPLLRFPGNKLFLKLKKRN